MNEKILALIETIKPGIRGHIGRQFATDGILDSLDVMNLIVALEEAFGIEIDPEEVTATNFESVDSIAALVGKYTDSSQ